mmetsp:Transcript_32732/g.66826  ORF Transcript_32732/g.66826 Transcript_32732/m.66826 type:complete len:266 (+) Transcript_32732:3661-4458(+)
MVEAASAYFVASTGAATSTVVASFNDDGAAVIVPAPATSEYCRGSTTAAADVPSVNKSILPLPLSYADTGALLVATSSTVPTFNEGTAAVDSELLAVSAYCVTSGTGAVAVASDNTFIFSLSKDRAGVLAAPSSTDDISLNDGATVEVDSAVAACIGAGDSVTVAVSDPTEASESCSICAAVAATLSADDASTGVLMTLPWLSIVTSLGVDAASIAVSGTGAATAAEEEESTPENSMAGAAAPTSSTPPPPPTTTPPSTSSTGTK